MTAISDLFSRLVVGQSTRYGALEVYPLFQRVDPSANSAHLSTAYVLLADALAAGTARVEEISEGGSVPTLRLINDGEVPVLAFDGEELVGAKQNRILSVTILAPPHATLNIPVACVEQGRWRYKSRAFAASEDMLFAKARAKKARAVRASVARRAGPNADQGEIWSDIADKYAAFHVEADTSAMSDVFEKRAAHIEGYEKTFTPSEGQIGAVFALSGRIFGLDLVERADICARLLPKLVRSYALDAVERDDVAAGGASATSPLTDEALAAFIKAVSQAPALASAAVGLGEDYRFDGCEIEGGALVHAGRALHVSAFAASELA